MAYTIINTTDTLEQMRVKLNNLTTNDFGDPSILAGAGITSTSITGAVVELANVAYSQAGFRIEDSTSSFQQIGAGQTLRVLGTSNQINAVVSATDTLTISLPSNVTIPNNLTANGTLHTLGTIEISGNNIRSTDSTTVRINDSLNVNGSISATSVSSTGAVSGTTITGTGAVSGTTITGSSTIQGTDLVLTSGGITFEGATDNTFETTLAITDPTQDRTITVPNITGTIVTTGDTGTVTSTMIADGTIVNADIADGTIRGAKLNVSSDSVTFANVTATNFTGTASIATTVTLNANNTNNETVYLTFSDTATGNQTLETDTSLSYNPSTNILSTTATQAQYADLAEIYDTDKNYDIGTVVMVGGNKEVTECFVGKRALGVISDRPAFLMNSKAKGQPVALKGRVKVKVTGDVKKGDELVAGNGGFATTISEEFTKVFAIALEDNDKGLIEAIIL
jgi:hypothetical protein